MYILYMIWNLYSLSKIEETLYMYMRLEQLHIHTCNKSFSYQDTLPMCSFLVCILNFGNKASNHIWLTIWPFVHEQKKKKKKKRKKKKKLDWTTNVNSNSYRNSSIYSEAIWVTYFYTAQGPSLFHAIVSEKQVAGEARDTTPFSFLLNSKAIWKHKLFTRQKLKKTALAFCL